MTNCANVENIVEYIRNVDPKQFANIRDEVFEVFEMEVDFEKIMDQDSDEEMLFDNTGYASDMSKYEIDRIKSSCGSRNLYVECSY